MKKKVVVGAALMMMPLVSFAGGYLTNTNQHAAFLRSLSRGAAIDIDGALSNPAGLSFLPTDGFRVGVSIQSAFQTRDIDASFGTYNGFDPVNKVPTVSDVPYKKYYKGKAAAPVIPSVFAAYKKGDWTISGFFAITGGGGKASFDDGLPMFESAAMAGIFQESVAKYIKTGGQSPIVTPDMYTINSAMDGKQYIYSLQLGLSYKITDWLSAFAGGRMNYFSGNYDGYLDAKLKQNFGGANNPSGAEYSRTSYYISKFMKDYKTKSEYDSEALHLWVMYRYGEVLLNYAEALNEYQSAPSQDVYDAIIALRKRAGIDEDDNYGLGALGSINKTDMRKIIQNERRIEMAFEEQRYWDIRRWRIAEEVFEKPLEGLNIQISGAVTTYYKINVLSTTFNVKRYFYPIPYSEVIKNKNMVQNPNW